MTTSMIMEIDGRKMVLMVCCNGMIEEAVERFKSEFPRVTDTLNANALIWDSEIRALIMLGDQILFLARNSANRNNPPAI